MFAVIVTGPPGAGKSTVATAVHDRLGDAGVANALMEVDELERCYPPLDEQHLFANLATICAAYREVGHDLMFVTATVEHDAYGERLLAAVGADAHLLVRLDAEPATLESRIRAREPAGWSGLEELVESSARLATELRGLGGVGLVLSTERATPDEVAARIEAAIGAARTGGVPPTPGR
ncbi:ATP-binding protein [Solihabitans fulvus]|uniref:ATP-binding protein n=1 Tax=Solihabitans fulvus TaxID=1892852 RepID=A0A5B2XPJ7_9PSEU|nr:AAA family ATPase [Solihabitans fulvus]KAA2265667.1 ATP-binding protein [Solihabitans fulvus]